MKFIPKPGEWSRKTRNDEKRAERKAHGAKRKAHREESIERKTEGKERKRFWIAPMLNRPCRFTSAKIQQGKHGAESGRRMAEDRGQRSEDGERIAPMLNRPCRFTSAKIQQGKHRAESREAGRQRANGIGAWLIEKGVTSRIPT